MVTAAVTHWVFAVAYFKAVLFLPTIAFNKFEMSDQISTTNAEDELES